MSKGADYKIYRDQINNKKKDKKVYYTPLFDKYGIHCQQKGPDYFNCVGLAEAAYESAGLNLTPDDEEDAHCQFDYLLPLGQMNSSKMKKKFEPTVSIGYQITTFKREIFFLKSRIEELQERIEEEQKEKGGSAVSEKSGKLADLQWQLR